jgi:hypothetical protein
MFPILIATLAPFWGFPFETTKTERRRIDSVDLYFTLPHVAWTTPVVDVVAILCFRATWRDQLNQPDLTLAIFLVSVRWRRRSKPNALKKLWSYVR